MPFSFIHSFIHSHSHSSSFNPFFSLVEGKECLIKNDSDNGND